MNKKKQKALIKPGTVGRLMSYLKNFKIQIVFVLVFIIISSVAGVVPSIFWKVLIDDYIIPIVSNKTPAFSGLAPVLMGMALIYAAGVITTLFYNRMMVVIAQGTLKKIRDEMFEKMQRLPIKYFDTHTHGDIMSHYTNDTDALRQMIAMVVPQVVSFFITIATIFISMLALSLWLTIFVAVCVVIMTAIVMIVSKRSSKYFIGQQISLGDVTGFAEEMVNGQKVVKVFCHENKALEGFDKKNDVLNYNATTANKMMQNIMPIMGNLSYILYVAIAIAGGAMALSGITNYSFSGKGVLTLGIIASFLVLARKIVMPIGMVAQQMNAIVMALAGASRIFELIDEEPENYDGSVSLCRVEEVDGSLKESEKHTGKWAWKEVLEDGTFRLTALKGNVILENVDFEYEEGKPVLKDVSLHADAGEKVAFVGATGAGKTTITNLINRFYDIADGKIRYDGININKIKKADLRHSMGIVLQDVNLFTGTVMENIRYGRLSATDEECIEAAKLANADSFIRMLPHGYDTVLEGDGSGLSQGQRQLISIARAAVADPPVMILDEATSSIDTRTEALVQAGMDSIMKGRTVFVIAHRLSTVRNSDVIMVLDHGKIIERGTHDRLIEKKGVYYQLYTGAFELE
ncbi:MAG: ABC transporter ATP-binding protein [Lachnospiraceae bacterium]|nr:ABC transporter ATP-binding protein [Lachnospiraceae bacterium]